MRRRRLLGLGASALPLVAGCLGTPESPRTDTPESPADGRTNGAPASPEDGDIETYTWNGPPRLDRTDANYPQGSVSPYFVALLRTTSEASVFGEAFLADAENEGAARGARTFLTETDFGGKCLVVFQDAAGSSHPELAVDSVDFTGETVHLRASYPGQGRTADTIENTLLARVRGSPTAAEVTLGEGAAATVATRNAIDAPRLADPRALVVRNRDCIAHGVGFDARIDGHLAASHVVEAPAGSIRVVAGAFAYAGDYTVRASIAGTGRAVETSAPIAADDPRAVLVDIDGQSEPTLARLDGTPSEQRIDCDAESRPYESSDPSENIDGSVALWVVNRASSGRRLTVTIADDGTGVFERTVDLAAGGDKVREAGLLRKKGDYSVTVEPESGDAVATTVEVRDGTSTLTVLVEASGEIGVHTG